jgi:hypothetical protein
MVKQRGSYATSVDLSYYQSNGMGSLYSDWILHVSFRLVFKTLRHLRKDFWCSLCRSLQHLVVGMAHPSGNRKVVAPTPPDYERMKQHNDVSSLIWATVFPRHRWDWHFFILGSDKLINIVCIPSHPYICNLIGIWSW